MCNRWRRRENCVGTTRVREGVLCKSNGASIFPSGKNTYWKRRRAEDVSYSSCSLYRLRSDYICVCKGSNAQGFFLAVRSEFYPEFTEKPNKAHMYILRACVHDRHCDGHTTRVWIKPSYLQIKVDNAQENGFIHLTAEIFIIG